jgi:hypothetical protein
MRADWILRLVWVGLFLGLVPGISQAEAPTPPTIKPVRLAVLTTLWRRFSHADVIAGRILQSDSFDGKGRTWPLEIVSAYVDQVGSDDISGAMSEKYGFKRYSTLEQALTLGGDKLAVDGVLVICEHGEYPLSAAGQVEYPKRRFFEAVYRCFEMSGRVVPVFNDKHIADNWTDAHWIIDTAERLKVPLMAGSSVPTWRRAPATPGPDGAAVAEACVLYYGPPEAYGFHAIDVGQALLERRRGGEAGVSRVNVWKGDAVWSHLQETPSAARLIEAALATDPTSKRFADLPAIVADPLWCEVQHRDGLRVHYLLLNSATREFTAAWRTADAPANSVSQAVWLQLDNDSNNHIHFGTLTDQISALMHTRKSPYPARRTLMSSGILHAMMHAYTGDEPGRDTPELDWAYTTDWVWPGTAQLGQ